MILCLLLILFFTIIMASMSLSIYHDWYAVLDFLESDGYIDWLFIIGTPVMMIMATKWDLIMGESIIIGTILILLILRHFRLKNKKYIRI